MQRAEIEAELERHHTDSFGWALACSGWDRERAEDLLQVTYLKLLEGRARFSGRSSFRTWLFAVIRRTAAERRRRERVQGLALARLFAGRAPPPRPDPEAETQRSQIGARLVSALSLLPARQREVLHLVFYGEQSIQEAAVAMGVSLGAARTHYERGKRRLRGLLEEQRP